MTAPFPAFDLSRFGAADAAGKRALGREVDAICRETGFLAVDHHGVPQPTIDALWNLGACRSSTCPLTRS